MIGLPPSTRVFLCLPPTDMRKSFDGLAALAVDVVRQEPLSGHLFVFRNRREDRIKVLYWDRTGFCLFYKRLEQGTFRFPAFAKASASRPGRVTTTAADAVSAGEIDAAELALILEGIDLNDAVRRKRYRVSAPVI
jgi:transposase